MFAACAAPAEGAGGINFLNHFLLRLGMAHPFDPSVLAAANISPRTGLATDYLNHFNEVAMLIGMLSDMPEAAEDVLAWQPCSYGEHFRRSGFRDRDLAIEAFECIEPHTRAGFEDALLHAECAVRDVQARLRAGGEPAHFCAESAAEVYEKIAALDAVITGNATHVDENQAAVDALFD